VEVCFFSNFSRLRRIFQSAPRTPRATLADERLPRARADARSRGGASERRSRGERTATERRARARARDVEASAEKIMRWSDRTRVDGEVSALRMGVMIIAIAHAFAFIVWMWLTLTQKPPRARDRVKAS
jgi:hypothetical protein